LAGPFLVMFRTERTGVCCTSDQTREFWVFLPGWAKTRFWDAGHLPGLDLGHQTIGTVPIAIASRSTVSPVARQNDSAFVGSSRPCCGMDRIPAPRKSPAAPACQSRTISEVMRELGEKRWAGWSEEGQIQGKRSGEVKVLVTYRVGAPPASCSAFRTSGGTKSWQAAAGRSAAAIFHGIVAEEHFEADHGAKGGADGGCQGFGAGSGRHGQMPCWRAPGFRIN